MDLSTPAYYGYISLYVLFFMLDDLVIFGLAAFAIQNVIDTRYAAVSRGAGPGILDAVALARRRERISSCPAAIRAVESGLAF